MVVYSRRLPVYLLLDCSESMAGSAIEEVSRGVDTMLAELQQNPFALETVWLSVITFSRTAKQIIPLTDIVDFRPPRLFVRTGTAMGAALRVLMHSIQRDVVKTTVARKGDYRPLVFLFSDGQPTDEWASVADQIKSQVQPRIANIYALGCGPDVDTEILRRITDIVLMMKNLSHEGWQKVFLWLSASVETVSQALERGQEGETLNLPGLPEDVLEIAPLSTDIRDNVPRQLFLHARCSQKGKLYLMRFQRQGHGGKYMAVCSHPLNEDDEDSGGELPAINSSLLVGCSSCPYCKNPLWVKCYCGVLSCWSGDKQMSHTCPRCQNRAMPEYSPFNVHQVQG
ncbi:MAG: hypothetical protein DDT32_00605 [Syntrophomonadaceae bacterium]|nr:hypothetical protein [Bacillota bacterium]MBT9146858.1 hypothetical protein [Bacillota bacterium]